MLLTRVQCNMFYMSEEEYHFFFRRQQPFLVCSENVMISVMDRYKVYMHTNTMK